MQGVGRLLDTRSAGKKLILEGFWTNSGKDFKGRVRFIYNLDGKDVVINDI